MLPAGVEKALQHSSAAGSKVPKKYRIGVSPVLGDLLSTTPRPAYFVGCSSPVGYWDKIEDIPHHQVIAGTLVPLPDGISRQLTVILSKGRSNRPR